MSTEVRALPYPVLEEGDLSWPQGHYDVSFVSSTHPDRNSVMVRHELSGAPFLQQIIDDGRAEYACSVAVPITNYRRLHLSRHAEQTISWETDFCSETPLLRPMILAVQQITHIFKPEDGIDEIWQAREITIPKGARLALGEYWGETASMENLLDIVLDEDRQPGSFKIMASEEKGFYFKAHTAPDLYRFLQNPQGQSQQRKSILTHMASRCLEILFRDFGPRKDKDTEEDIERWTTHRNLKGLAGLLEKNECPLWDHEDFAADEVATILYPHFITLEESGVDEE